MVIKVQSRRYMRLYSHLYQFYARLRTIKKPTVMNMQEVYDVTIKKLIKELS